MGLGSGFEWDGQTSVRESGEGAYAADLADGWRVGGGLNGGYLLSVMGNAVKASVPSKPDPIAVSAHYLSASVPGPAVVETRVLRQGGSLATVPGRRRTHHCLGDVRRPLGTANREDQLLRRTGPAAAGGVCLQRVRACRDACHRASDGPLRHAFRPGNHRLGRGRAERRRPWNSPCTSEPSLPRAG